MLFRSGKNSRYRYEFICLFSKFKPELINPNLLGNAPLVLEDPNDGTVPLNSSFYVSRKQVEDRCYETVLKPGSLIRIKGPQMMGKTSLLERVLERAENNSYQTLYLDMTSVDLGTLTRLDKFLRWLCVMVQRRLKLKDKLNDYWAEILGPNSNCTDYFEEYLLNEIDSPIVLAFDDIDRLFHYPKEVAEDFFGMLRSWHENGKKNSLWQQLRLVVAHSTEAYIPLDINRSPFNVGVPIELPEFNREQVLDLAKRHNLKWQNDEVDKFMEIVGGHPYLVRLGLYHLGKQELSLRKLLENAATEEGIYKKYLQELLLTLQEAPELPDAFKKVVTSPEPVELNSIQIYKLDIMGLVQIQDKDRKSTRLNSSHT